MENILTVSIKEAKPALLPQGKKFKIGIITSEHILVYGLEEKWYPYYYFFMLLYLKIFL